MKMKELPISERPYEKLEMYGASALSNAELIAIIIKCGTKEESSVSIAQKILSLEKNGEEQFKIFTKCINRRIYEYKGDWKSKSTATYGNLRAYKKNVKTLKYKSNTN